MEQFIIAEGVVVKRDEKRGHLLIELADNVEIDINITHGTSPQAPTVEVKSVRSDGHNVLCVRGEGQLIRGEGLIGESKRKQKEKDFLILIEEP